MLKIREHIDATGALTEVFLREVDGALEIVVADQAVALPPGALGAVMSRYGAPFDPEAAIAVVATLAVGGGALRHVRHLAGYDVIARDYLVHDAGAGQEPLCALATTVARALEHLAAAVRVRAAG